MIYLWMYDLRMKIDESHDVEEGQIEGFTYFIGFVSYQIDVHKKFLFLWKYRVYLKKVEQVFKMQTFCV